MYNNILFNQANSLILIGRKRTIDELDFIDLPSEYDRNLIGIELLKKNNKSVIKFLWQVISKYKKSIFISLIFLLLSSTLMLSVPILIHEFIVNLKSGVENPQTLNHSIFICLYLGFATVLIGIFEQHSYGHIFPVEQRLNGELNMTIFKKILRLHVRSRMKYTSGDIVNMASSDSLSVSEFAFLLVDSLNTLFVFIFCLIELWNLFGSSSISAYCILFLSTPLTKYFVKNLQKANEQMLNLQDQRISILSQAISGIRLIKYFGWTHAILNEIQSVRQKELNKRKIIIKNELILNIQYASVSSLMLIATLVAFVLTGGELSLELVITSTTLMVLLKAPLDKISHHIYIFSQCYTSGQRLLNFLNEQEIQEKYLNNSNSLIEPVSIQIKNINVSILNKNNELESLNKNDGTNKKEIIEPQKTIRNSNSNDSFKNCKNLESNNKSDPNLKFVLNNISLTVKAGQSVAVVGDVGSGKSILLQSILGEWDLASGSIEFLDKNGQSVLPSIAYVPQTAFIINNTIKENILFGSKNKISKEKLDKAIFLSSLCKDLISIPKGIDAEIGENGINLSGGQKQRIALARAYLSEANVILLDDPLSAVDSKTEQAICKNLFFEEWKGRTIVTVTHRLEFLHLFDHVVFIQNGMIADQGSFDYLYNKSVEFFKFYQHHEFQKKSYIAKNKTINDWTEEITKKLISNKKQAVDADSTQMEFISNNFEIPADIKSDFHGRITVSEEINKGKIPAKYYLEYLKDLIRHKSKSKLILIGLILAAMASAYTPVLENIWLGQIGKYNFIINWISEWSKYLKINLSNNFAYLGFYMFLVTLTALSFGLRCYFWFYRGSLVGKKMHEVMLESVLKSPIRFFDSNPTGRILQRFSRDLQTIDLYFQFEISYFITMIFSGLASLSYMLYVMPLSFLFILPIGFIFYHLQKDYRNSAREVKRLSSVLKSPIISFVNEAVSGFQVIRSFGAEETFIKEFENRNKKYLISNYNALLLNRWFSVRIPVLGGLLVLLSGIILSFLSKNKVILPAEAALSLVYSLSVWSHLNIGLRTFSELEVKMTSYERIKSFTELPKEDQVLGSSFEVSENWPLNGEIQFCNVSVKYAPHLPYVLKDLSFRILPRMKVGIVGRTGSGKSTLTQVLYRFINPDVGQVLIDGLDITKISLDRLRQSLAIIPQDPVFLLGSLRSNLDRENKFDDAAIETALRKVSMWKEINQLPGGINTMISENGWNFSQGQRQLLCLARAMLNNSKILIMDEATASVDVRTDQEIQSIVKKYFNNSTVLIIAHRFSTLDNVDMILHIEDGGLKKSHNLRSLEL